jgi:TRAP-type C4-dicarboxylate transport system permease small subunit
VDRCAWVLAGIAGIVLFLLLLAVCFATISRYVANKPFAQLIDLSTYALVWVAFLAAPWLMLQRGHVTIDLFITKVKPRSQLRWTASAHFAMVAIALFMAYISGALTVDYLANGRVMQDIMSTPQWILLLPIPLGSFFLAMASAVNGLQDIRQLRTIAHRVGHESTDGVV